ncbi:hypothetical protein GOODEAATRI_021885 [Goodea atripinnis]|uniref:Uncharacterized protein n=1 Tax=Goodea atripinnis TaxID=208336 RepID=A0ABV0NM81_9TELE
MNSSVYQNILVSNRSPSVHQLNLSSNRVINRIPNDLGNMLLFYSISLWHCFYKLLQCLQDLSVRSCIDFLQDLVEMMGELDQCTNSSPAHPKDSEQGKGLVSVMASPCVRTVYHAL